MGGGHAQRPKPRCDRPHRGRSDDQTGDEGRCPEDEPGTPVRQAGLQRDPFGGAQEAAGPSHRGQRLVEGVLAGEDTEQASCGHESQRQPHCHPARFGTRVAQDQVDAEHRKAGWEAVASQPEQVGGACAQRVAGRPDDPGVQIPSPASTASSKKARPQRSSDWSSTMDDRVWRDARTARGGAGWLARTGPARAPTAGPRWGHARFSRPASGGSATCRLRCHSNLKTNTSPTNMDWTFYVLGGSSTSNQIVGHGVIGQDDIVLVDANCHKSICHSLTVTGARPVYATPTRNGYGMIGLVPIHRFSPQAIKQLVDESPLTAGAPSKELTYAVVTNSTYDGLCYDVNRVVAELAQSVPRVHFDEAWYAYAKFHQIYRGRFAMDVPDEMPNRPTLFAVQSTHKMLAAFSMASMVHIKLSPRAPLEYDQFNESFMMHGTTSPFYPLIASLDVAAAMMEEPAGPTLMNETIQDAITFRKAMSSVAHRLREAEGGGDGSSGFISRTR